jgi:4-amino-4-deoxy-L-arabinose transferase-like glycosyltransferase
MSEPAGGVAPSRARTSATWYTALLLAALTILLRLPAFLASRHLVFDDGTYGVSVLDMRHGLAPYTGVFSSQGPLHFPLLYVGDLLGFRTIDGPRVTPMLAGVAATIAAWAVARRLAGRTAGVIAGVLVATSGSMIWTTGQVTGDGPAAALALCAVWAALVYRDDPRLRRAVLTGLVMGAALAVKPLLLPAALPVGWWLWSRRRADHLGAAVGAAIVLWFASALPWGLGNVWRQSVTYNTGAGPHYAKLGQLRKLLSTLGSRDLLVVAALLLVFATALASARIAPRRRGGRPVGPLPVRRDDAIVIAVWAGVTALVLVLEPAMYRNHLAAIAPPLAILAAVLVRQPRVLAVVLIVLAPWSAHSLSSILTPTGYRGDAAAIMHSLRELPADAQVISDEPGFVYRANLRTPKLLNDPSVKRIDQHLLTTASVAGAASDPRVCAVVVWSSRFGRDLPGLPAALRGAGLVEADRYSGLRALWLRPTCPH